MENDKTDVFISYYHKKDEKIAEIIKKAIGQALYGDETSTLVFRGEDSLFPGSLWIKEIRKKLQAAKVVVVICSPESVNRPWVAFECGAVIQRQKEEEKMPIFAYCHSGVKKEELPCYLKGESVLCIAADEEKALDKLIGEISESLNEKISQNYDSYQKSLDEEVKESLNELKAAEKKKETREKKPQKYLPCTLRKEDDGSITLEFETKEQKKCSDKGGCFDDEGERLGTLKKMQDFLSNNKNEVKTGIAIGIQNCIYDPTKGEKGQMYVGIRYKSEVDAKETGMSLTRGEFNTGYKLIRDYVEDKNKIIHVDDAERVAALQDLFVTTNVKFPIEPSEKEKASTNSEIVFEHINKRLELFGSKLFRIGLHPYDDSSDKNGKESEASSNKGSDTSSKDKKREYTWASIFINNSCWYPRFEIGIWKFMVMPNYETKSCEKNHHFITGFGEDVFQDYRGNIENPWDQINYWVWIRDGQIAYRSYPEERYLPRFVPQRRQWNDCHGILISSEDLKKHYGINDDLTPMVPDEILENADSIKRVIKTKASQPAVRLLTWF